MFPITRGATRQVVSLSYGGAAVTKGAVDTVVNDPLAQEIAAQTLAQFLPPHIGDSILEIANIVYQEFSGELMFVDVNIALSVIAIMQGLSKKPVYDTRKFSRVEDSPIAKRFAHYMKYADAAYGTINPLKTDEEFIADYTGIPRYKVQPYVNKNAVRGKAMLEHFMAVDDREKSVIVALKGTGTLEAALKDVRFLYTEIDLWGQSFQVHGGMWEAAQGLVQFPLLISQVTEALVANPEYGLVVLGHSLGGGVAGLVAPLLAEPGPDGSFLTNGKTVPGRKIECYGLEPAASLDEQLRQKTKTMTYSLVNKNDIVPALSYGVLQDFKAFALYLKHNTLYLGSIIDGLSMNRVDPDTYMAKFRSIATHKKLVPPGRVWVIDTTDNGTLEIAECLNANQRFGEARFILGMVQDHILFNCFTSMDALKHLFE
ncbi:alpha/beta-hydrolase [Morchella conica CCBAS932]|uniref:sn-1-specific diacylglycerol lipase n=1 Tax=Morchella conica CCBAS932 TaxID=1392247 RepID=A0A3N4KEN6_9PEZI|nr:alpha/beta-hydrolase [Morchella conica CCBAS932]